MLLSRTIYRGSESERSNAKNVAPPPFYLELERKCSNAKDVPLQGKGQDIFAEMPCNKRPSQPVKGGHKISAEMPNKYRPHRIWASSKPQKCNAYRAQ